MAHSLRPISVYPITVRRLKVLRVKDVTPGMRRVTLGGPELAAHLAENGMPVAAFRSDGFDDEGKIFLKHPDAAEAVVPTQGDGVVNWPRHHPHLLFRTYTVRRWDPNRGEVDLDFVKHGTGPATTWASTVQPGEYVHWAGPKSSATHPVGVDWTLVAGDETALPAIGRWLEEWPAGQRGQVFIEVAEASHRQLDLPVPDGVEVTWLTRDGAEAGTTTLLFDAIKAADWWEGKVFAWVAGETLTLTPIRRWLRNEKGLSKEQVEVTGYWRRQSVVVDDSGAVDLDATKNEAAAFHELTHLTPGFALRIASTIGLPDAFDQHPRTVDELAQATGATHVGITKLLRYLCTIGIVEAIGEERFQLTNRGRELEKDRIAEGLNLKGVQAQRELAGLLALLTAIRPEQGDQVYPFGTSRSDLVLHNETWLASHLEDQAESATYVAGALAASPLVSGLNTIAIAGQGPGVFATEIVTAHPTTQVTLIASPTQLDVLRSLHGKHERITHVSDSVFSQQAQLVDAVLLTNLLFSLPDVSAEQALRQAAAHVRPGGHLLVLSDVLHVDLAHDHDFEDDLVEFALSGGGARTYPEHLALFARAGLSKPDRSTIGWGFTLFSFPRTTPHHVTKTW